MTLRGQLVYTLDNTADPKPTKMGEKGEYEIVAPQQTVLPFSPLNHTWVGMFSAEAKF